MTSGIAMNHYAKLLLALPILLLLNSTYSAERVPWESSRIVGNPEPPKPYTIERVYSKLQFEQPVELVPLGDSGKMLLLEVGGKVYTFDDDPECDEAQLAFDLQPL